ncbi:hypothetical protein HK102_004169, partial [Quaeritorhiza haematococci]
LDREFVSDLSESEDDMEDQYLGSSDSDIDFSDSEFGDVELPEGLDDDEEEDGDEDSASDEDDEEDDGGKAKGKRKAPKGPVAPAKKRKAEGKKKDGKKKRTCTFPFFPWEIGGLGVFVSGVMDAEFITITFFSVHTSHMALTPSPSINVSP